MRLMNFVAAAVCAGVLAGCATPPPPPPPPPPAVHPAYLRALSDLRGARWMLEHRPGDWAQTGDEIEAVRQIDAAIGDLRQAAYDDHKNLNDHPPVDEIPARPGRLHAADDYLRKARNSISREEDNPNAAGWRNNAIGHIDAALAAVHRALGS